ncbi:MAG: thioredoxin-like domain-containing protein [Candidatus Sulfotelmatobacter sp.]
MGWKSRFRFFSILWIFASLLPVDAQTGVDLNGHAVNPLAADTGKVVVLVFLRRDCPVSGRYAPVIQQISRRYADSASFFLVYPDKSESSEAIRKSVADYGYHLPVVRDPEGSLAKLSHVQITPEVAVFHNRKLVYDGRIDDWYVDLTRARPAPTTHELEDAIRAAQTGSSLAHNEVRGVGCYIADVE